VKQRISFAQLVGTTIKSYRLEQLTQQQQHMAIFQVRRASTEQICQMRLFTLPEEITAQDRLILLGQVQQEMSYIAALQHPVIQPILEYGFEQGLVYLVTPFVPVRYALANVLSTQGPLDIIETGYNLELLTSALEYAHKHAITHGNLTAANVFLRPSADSHPPTVLLTDIGIAHLQALLKSYSDAAVGLVPSLHHAEPLLGQPVDSVSDLSALGALLYQMLTAHDIFASGWQKPGMPPQIFPLNTWRQGLPTRLDGVISKALTSDPATGYQSLDALVDAYYQIITPGTRSQKTVRARQVRAGKDKGRVQGTGSAQGTIPTAGSAHLTRRKLTVALAAAGAGVVAVGGGWLFLQSLQGPQATQSKATAHATSLKQSTDGGTVIAHVADLSVNQASTFAIPNSKSRNPGVLIHLPDDRFVAFDSTCTHQGCGVGYSTTSGQLECPCHGAVFDPTRDAAVVVGPATTPLVPINIHVNTDGTIVIV
jgi:Rieske Fe-S protein